MTRYLLIGCTPYVARAARNLPAGWAYSATTDVIDSDTAAAFFVHWRSRVPVETLHHVECVGFHAAALPEGRGGSPVQNQIARGVTHTVLTAYRMTEEVDAGPIYATMPLCLGGSADEIYDRIARAAVEMAQEIVTAQTKPTPQIGSPEWTVRRTPGDSALSTSADLRTAFDHIRMLDADGYPHAFVPHGQLRLTFRRAAWRVDRIVADVEITEAML